MNWTDRLNHSATHVSLGSGDAEIHHWDYDPFLPDNVPHRHTYFEICLIGGYGQGIFSVEDKPHEIGPGDIFFARPGVIHQIQNTSTSLMELFWVCWCWRPKPRKSSEIPGAVSEIDRLMNDFSDSSILVAADQNNRVTSLWRALRGFSTGSPLPGTDLQTTSLASSLLLALAQAGTPARSVDTKRTGFHENQMPGRLGRLAVRYIHDNLYRPISVEEVASHIHVSARHLTRLMQEFTGTAPAAYIEQARIERAHAQLMHGTKSIKEIAAEVGYDDVHHFTRVFTRRVGSSPGRFRTDNKHRQSPDRDSLVS